MACIFRACEKRGDWPRGIFAVLIVLLPKPDGGRRPIGLFDTKVRLWMRIRSQVARLWEAANPSPAIFGGKGCGAQRAAWMSSLAAEAAHLARREHAQTLIDLVKAFERIPHAVLVQFAIKWNYCLLTLRLSLAAYRLVRLICIDGICSRPVQATRGITAGAGMATSELRLFMLDLVLTLNVRFTAVRQTLYVDDLTLEASGETELAAKQLADATDVSVQYLEGKLLAEVSPTKTVFLTQSKRGKKAVAAVLRTRKVKFAKTSKLLGVQTVAGKRRCTAALQARLATFKRKIPRIQRLRNAGINVRQITAAVGVPAFYYGAHCSGVADTHLDNSRRAVARAVGTITHGQNYERALYMCDVAGTRLDPAFDAHALPIQYYSLAWWEHWTDLDELRLLFRQAWYKLAAAQWKWNGVTGPLSAAIATARRLEWNFTAPHLLSTDIGEELDLSRDPPAYIVKHVHDAVRRWQLAKVLRLFPGITSNAPTVHYNGAQIHSRLLPGGVVCDNGALAALTSSRRGIPKKLAGMWTRDARPWLHSTAAGAQWPQARVAAVPTWTDDSSCQLCGHTPGNLAHRVNCPANTPYGGWLPPCEDARAGLNRLSRVQKDILFGTGLMAIQVPVPAPPKDEEFHWFMAPPASSKVEELRWYIDGSLIDPQTPFQRVGAGIIGIRNGVPEAVAMAIPPPWISTIPGAEAWTLYLVLSMCCSPPNIMTDCLGNRRTLLEGKEMATAANRPLARVWAAIFACCEGLLLQQLDDMLTWGPAHTTLASLGTRLRSDGRPLTPLDWRANNVADAAAKMAAHKYRAPMYIRQAFQQLRAAQLYGAAMAGVACREANNHKCSEIDADGEIKTVVRRDSIGRQTAISHHIDVESGSIVKVSKANSSMDHGHDSDDLEAYLPADFPRPADAISLGMAAALCEGVPTALPTSLPAPKPSRKQSSNVKKSVAPAKRRQVHDKRGEAIQAAALANRIGDLASRPAPGFEAMVTPTPAHTQAATALSEATRSDEPAPETIVMSRTCPPPADQQCAAPLSMTRESFIGNLRTMLPRIPRLSGNCDPPPAASASHPVQTRRSYPAVASSNTAFPANARGFGLTDAMRRLMSG